MPKVPFDFSFAREGRALSGWLLDLVAEDSALRLRAGEALQAMMFGYPSIHTDIDDLDWESAGKGFGGQDGRFREAVRGAVAEADFPAADFVRRLISLRVALKDDWHRRVEQATARNATSEARGERLAQRIRDAGDEPERALAEHRRDRWLAASLGRDFRRDRSIYEGAESMTAAGMMSGAVFDALDVALLADRPGLYRMLADGELFWSAAEALAQIGPPALDFAGFFLDRLEAAEQPRGFDGARALGSIVRDDPAAIDGLLRRLREGTPAVRDGAAASLGHAGPPLAGRLEVALDLLNGATRDPDLAFSAIGALASVGRNCEKALGRVLELAAPKPPRLVEASPIPYDEAMAERGVAIDALHHFRRFVDRAIPALVDAFDNFEEYDSDWDYHGEHARTCAALASFGAGAAPAVPRLIRYLDEWMGRPVEERPWPADILDLIKAIGPDAAAALPALERVRASSCGEDEDPEPLDPNEPLDRTILALRGEL
jgi:hypothetical protein